VKLNTPTRRLAASLLVLILPNLGAADFLDCVIEPKAIINLVVSEKGRIVDITVARGATVSKGQVLVQLEDDAQQLQVETARVRMNSVLEIRAAEIRLAQREKDVGRAQALAERQAGAVAKLEQATIEMELTKLTLEQARLSHALSKIEYEQAKLMLFRRTVLSPTDGVVMSVDIAPGAFASEQVTIMSIAVINPLHVEVFAPAKYYGHIAVGDVFDIIQEPPLTGIFPAMVNVVDKVFDAASSTFGIQLAIENYDGTIPAGTRCQIDMKLN